MKKIITESQKQSQILLKEIPYTLTEGVSLRFAHIAPPTHIIISISKKTAQRATKRNKIKRQLRAILRTSLPRTIRLTHSFFINLKISALTKDSRKEILNTLTHLFPVL